MVMVQENPPVDKTVVFKLAIGFIVILATLGVTIQVMALLSLYKYRKVLTLEVGELLGWETRAEGGKPETWTLGRKVQLLRAAIKLRRAESTRDEHGALDEIESLVYIVRQEALGHKLADK